MQVFILGEATCSAWVWPSPPETTSSLQAEVPHRGILQSCSPNCPVWELAAAQHSSACHAPAVPSQENWGWRKQGLSQCKIRVQLRRASPSDTTYFFWRTVRMTVRYEYESITAAGPQLWDSLSQGEEWTGSNYFKNLNAYLSRFIFFLTK